MEDRVRTSTSAGIADVRLIRTDQMNALDPPMFDGLRAEPEARPIAEAGEEEALIGGANQAEASRWNFEKRAGNFAEVSA
jgi:enoyl-CoA hydratase/carnithine racemase